MFETGNGKVTIWQDRLAILHLSLGTSSAPEPVVPCMRRLTSAERSSPASSPCSNAHAFYRKDQLHTQEREGLAGLAQRSFEDIYPHRRQVSTQDSASGKMASPNRKGAAIKAHALSSYPSARFAQARNSRLNE